MNAPSSRHLSLDLVRGICALAIAIYHFLAWRHGVVITSMGTFGVYIFFILSALAMQIRYSHQFGSSISAHDLKAFAVARVARIIPLLAAVSIFRAIYFASRNGDFLGELPAAFLTSTALMALNLPGFISNATGAWTLGIEMAFYLVFPVVALLLAQASMRSMIVVLVVALVAQHALLYLIRDLPSPQFWHYYATPLTFAPFFLIGFLIFRCPTTKRPSAFIAAAICLGVIFGFSLLVPGDLRKAPAAYAVLTALAGLTVLFAYMGQLPRVLNRMARFLGEISYALYLTHWFVYRGVRSLVDAGIVPVAVEPLAFVGGAIAVSWTIYIAFERPARNWIRGRFGAPSTSAHPATAP